jgi:hypothetical protein
MLAPSERERVFAVLMDALYSSGLPGRYHMLAFPDFTDRSLRGALRGYLTRSVPMTLFRVVHRSRLEAEERADLGMLPPAFEMALV